MARTLYPARSAMNWSASTWSLSDGGAEDESKPGVATADLVVFANAANDVTMDEASNPLGAFTLGGGDFDMASFAMPVNGDVVVSGGGIANPGTVTQGGESAMDWGSGSTFHYALAAAAVVTIGGATCFVRSFSAPAGATLQPLVDQTLAVLAPEAGWWVSEATVTVHVLVTDTNAAPGGDIVLVDKNLTIQSSATHAITMDGDIHIGTGELRVMGTGVGDAQSVTMNGNALMCGPVVLGATSGTGEGNLDLDGATHSIASIAGRHDDNDANTLALGTCSITMTTGIAAGSPTQIDTVTATVVHLYGNGSSTIKGVDISAGGTIYCHDFDRTGSTGNDGDIRFVSGGSQMLMGVGS